MASGVQHRGRGGIHRLARFIAKAAIVGTLLVLAGVAVREFAMFSRLERALLYFPSHEVAHPLHVFDPRAEDVWFGEQESVHGVFVPAPTGLGGSGITVVFFHGNGGNLSHRAPLISRMRNELGVGALIIDYQGYGKSAGVPSERATQQDARAALRYLHSRPDVDPARLVYYGESLGGAVALQLASEQPPLGLIVQSSFTSVADMTRLHYPLLSILLPLASSRYDSLAAVPSLRAPIMFVHGAADSLVPPDHSQRLHDAASGPKRLLMIPRAGHNDVFVQGGPGLWQSFRDFLASLDVRPG